MSGDLTSVSVNDFKRLIHEQSIERREKDLKNGEVFLDENGISICAACGCPREKISEDNAVSFILCKCQIEKHEAAKAQREKEHDAVYARRRVENLRRQGISDPKYLKHTFEKDDSPKSKQSKIARAYVDKWAAMKANGVGLLLYGGVGAGKSFYAGCIANRLIDQGVPCVMTSTIAVLNKLTAHSFDEEKTRIIQRIAEDNDLIIIDDVGAEYQSEFRKEMLFHLFDSIYRSGKPLILTSNLTPIEFQDTSDVGLARIFDRILERCQPVKFEQESRRRKKLVSSRSDVERILGIELS